MSLLIVLPWPIVILIQILFNCYKYMTFFSNFLNTVSTNPFISCLQYVYILYYVNLIWIIILNMLSPIKLSL